MTDIPLPGGLLLVGASGQAAQPARQPAKAVAGASFAQAMQDALGETEGVRFSRHAAERLESRHLTLAGDEMQKLNSAVDKAATSGQRDSLVLLGGLAFIVDVPGRTVVTAMPVDESQSNVFTHIDGAVIA